MTSPTEALRAQLIADTDLHYELTVLRSKGEQGLGEQIEELAQGMKVKDAILKGMEKGS